MSINSKIINMGNIGRPKKHKIIQGIPKITQFSPRGKPGRPDEVELNIEGFEAIRLADYEKKAQKEAANSIGISQQHFSRILERAHETIADALVNGKIIRIMVNNKINQPKKKNPGEAASKISPHSK